MDDWLIWRHGFASKPEVLAMAHRLNVEPDLLAARLMRLWEWCDREIPEDKYENDTAWIRLPSLHRDAIDARANMPGLCDAMEEAHWLHVGDGMVAFIHLGRHLGPGRRRELAKLRKRDQRKRQKEAAEKKPRKKATRERDPIWDAIVARFFPSGVDKRERTRVGRVVAMLKEKKATVAQIEARCRAAERAWKCDTFKPEAIVNNWDVLNISSDSSEAEIERTRKLLGEILA